MHARHADVARFTAGDCHILARAIQRRTGWPIYTFHSKLEAMLRPTSGGLHAFVVMPDGRALDVKGAQPLDAFCKAWREPLANAKETPWASIRKEWMQGEGPAFGRYSYRRAAIIAERLLAAL